FFVRLDLCSSTRRHSSPTLFPCTTLFRSFEYLSAMRRFLQWRKGDAIMLGEANVLPTENKKYFGEEGDGIHLMFNFYVNQYLFRSEEHTSELQSRENIVCRLLLERKKMQK